MRVAAYAAIARSVVVLAVAVPLAMFDRAGAACGVERWSVKTGTDADAGLIDLSHSVPTTVAELRAAELWASAEDTKEPSTVDRSAA